VLADINEEGLDTATGALTSAGHQAIGIACDVADEAQVAAMIVQSLESNMAENGTGVSTNFLVAVS
jgi:hypothetical protein